VEDLFGKAKPTYADIERVYRWKSSRSVGHFLANDAERVVSTVRSALRAKDDAAALARVRNPHRREGAHRPLPCSPSSGRTGTRSWTGELGKPLEAFGYLEELRRASWTNVWPAYMSLCRDIASRTGVSLRDLRSRVVERAGEHPQALTSAPNRTDGLLH
jgi:hypothetical protein